MTLLKYFTECILMILTLHVSKTESGSKSQFLIKMISPPHPTILSDNHNDIK